MLNSSFIVPGTGTQFKHSLILLRFIRNILLKLYSEKLFHIFTTVRKLFTYLTFAHVNTVILRQYYSDNITRTILLGQHNSDNITQTILLGQYYSHNITRTILLG